MAHSWRDEFDWIAFGQSQPHWGWGNTTSAWSSSSIPRGTITATKTMEIDAITGKLKNLPMVVQMDASILIHERRILAENYIDGNLDKSCFVVEFPGMFSRQYAIGKMENGKIFFRRERHFIFGNSEDKWTTGFECRRIISVQGRVVDVKDDNALEVQDDQRESVQGEDVCATGGKHPWEEADIIRAERLRWIVESFKPMAPPNGK